MLKPLLSLLLLPGFAAAQASHTFTLHGQVSSGVNAPAKAYLLAGNDLVDSAQVRRGRFTLHAQPAQPTQALVLLSYRGNPHELNGTGFFHADYHGGFYLEPGTLTLRSADSLKHARLLGGGELTRQWQELALAQQPVTAGFRQYYTDQNAAPAAERKSPAFQQRRAVLLKQRNAIDSAFVVAHPASLVSLNEVAGLNKPDSVLTRYLLSCLAPTLRTSPAGQQVQAKLAAYRRPPLAVGMLAPDFTLPDAQGRPVALSSYRGRYVLVDFWASWCKPCREENPNVVRTYEAFKNKAFEVLSVSIDVPNNRAQWLQAVQADRLPWAQVLDQPGPGAVAKLYQVQAIPQNLLLDPQGRLVAKNLRGPALQAALAQLVK